MYKLIQQQQQHYQQQQNKYKKAQQNNDSTIQDSSQDSSQQLLMNDITKMHLLPPHCGMSPHSYTDFFNDSAKLHGVAPYHLHVAKHKKDGKPQFKLQYNNFYSDFKSLSICVTSFSKV